jgi:hypothetical protein
MKNEMNKFWMVLSILATLSFISCDNKKNIDNSNAENVGKADSLGTEHENTPPGTETDTFGTNPDK